MEETLYKIQATLFHIFQKTWVYHWNVIGGDFYQVHALLGEQYNFMFGELDTLAEHIRTYEIKALGSLSEILDQSIVSEITMRETPTEMLSTLLYDHNRLIGLFMAAHTKADAINKPATSGLLEQMMADHEKICWKLRSMLK